MKKIIEARDLSKKYMISNSIQSSYSTLVETLAFKFSGVKRKLLNSLNNKISCESKFDEFWALKDLSFDICEGDRVGIIGKNGAGKSTLLKIMSRITAPSSGSVRIRGKVSSLLEVGTGFHQELTGRENIFLNGTILGMRRKEIEKKFDEIVDFSEIEKFLDTPVKRYSSGMFTRLGFAIAAHLDSDLLIIDEVLAVGDAAFQKKCLKKLDELGTSGRTVLFVSHDVGSVLKLCNKGIYLENGLLKEYGNIDHCVSAYMKNFKSHDYIWKGDAGDENVKVSSVEIIRKNFDREFFYQGEKVQIEITYQAFKPVRDLFFGIAIWSPSNQLIARSTTADVPQESYIDIKVGLNRLTFTIDTNLLFEGEYLIKIESFIHNVKKILSDEIVMKLPVYLHEKTIYTTQRNGVSLGNDWVNEHI